jgi:hypothetical protein
MGHGCCVTPPALPPPCIFTVLAVSQYDCHVFTIEVLSGSEVADWVVTLSVPPIGFRGRGAVEFWGPMLQNTCTNLLNDYKC